MKQQALQSRNIREIRDDHIRAGGDQTIAFPVVDAAAVDLVGGNADSQPAGFLAVLDLDVAISEREQAAAVKLVGLKNILDDLSFRALPVVVQRAVDAVAEELRDTQRCRFIDNVLMVRPARKVEIETSRMQFLQPLDGALRPPSHGDRPCRTSGPSLCARCASRVFSDTRACSPADPEASRRASPLPRQAASSERWYPCRSAGPRNREHTRRSRPRSRLAASPEESQPSSGT